MSNLEEEIMIQPFLKRLRHDNAESKIEDRLSDLPDYVLLHILNFLNTKDAVRTCILSSRWKPLWKRITTIRLDSSDFSKLKSFTKIFSKVLSLRDHSMSLRSLSFSRKGSIEVPLLKRILKYAISHNIQRLVLIVNREIEKIPSSIFSCRTLTHLMLQTSFGRDSEATIFPKSLNLPALTKLYLSHFAFCADNNVADPFLTFNKLNHLVLDSCEVRDAITLRISSSTLVCLSMYCYSRNSLKIVDLCTPSLHRFVFTCAPQVRFKGSNLSSIKHVNVDADLSSYHVYLAFNLFSWLRDFVGIKSMVLTTSTLQVLSFIPNLLKFRLPFLKNLKSLKVLDQELSEQLCTLLRIAKLQKDKSLSRKEAVEQLLKENKGLKGNFTRSPPLLDGIADFLLQNSPCAKVDILDLSRYPFVRRSMDLAS